VDNREVHGALAEIAVLLGLSPEGRFKAEAYQRGAQIVATLPELAALVEAERLTEIDGIGASLSAQISELVRTGRSALLERLRSQYPKGAAELSGLPGMTLRRIKAVSEGLGVSSLDELHEACREQRVRALPGFGAKTEQRLLDALREREQVATGPVRMRIAEAQLLAAELCAQLVRLQVADSVEPVGALRRGEEIIDELELLAFGERGRVLEALPSLPSLVLLEGEGRARLSSGLPLVVHVAPASAAGEHLLLTTGPEVHVEAMRARASERGRELGELGPGAGGEWAAAAGSGAAEGAAAAGPGAGAEHAAAVGQLGPGAGGERPAVAHERALYVRLGLPYVPPEARHLPIDAAGYDDLVEVGDVRGMVHCHTTYSDGKASIEEMARAAEALGMQYITITDHSPSAHYARGVELDRLKQQWDEIAAVQERVSIRILRGTESDILGDGNLDYPDAVLEQLDVVIASIHSRLRMNRDEMTTRLVRAMEQPVFKIWGHALGRLLLKRDPIDCDVERVLDALASSRGAVEVNGDPYRLDLPPMWLPAAKARGLRFVLSVDAHSTKGMRALSYAVTMARRGGLRRADVLNTLPTPDFLAQVKV